VRYKLAVLVIAAACGNGSATPQQQQQRPKDAGVADADPTKLATKDLYVTLCAPCHGADAKGYKADHAPSLINKTFLESATDEYLQRSIALGRPGTSMAGYGKQVGGPLDDAALARLTAWLRSQGPQPQPLAAVAAGDPMRGAPIYAKTCQKCHGDQTTRGEGVHLANPRFLDAATDSFVRYAIVRGRPGTPMEAFAGKLSDAEIDDVVAYVRSLGKPPVVGQLPPPTGKEPLVINPGGKDPVFKLRADPCPPAGSGQPTCKEDPRFVSIDQVKKALDDKRKMIIIDARPASDWMRAHATGAVSIPYMELKRLDEMPKDGTWAIAYCACPHHLSGIVVDELRKRGYKHAVVLDEGILEWQRRGYPVVAAPGVEAPPKEPPMAPGTLP
jgi:cytochrome c oxidase cbb3-type subunit 3